jgi:carboxypeptidase Taq
MENTYEGYKLHLQKIAHLNSAIALLSWDQEIFMPLKGASVRAQQFSTLSTMVFELETDLKFENLVNHLLSKSCFGFKEMRNLQVTKQSIEDSKKLSVDFIKKTAIAKSEAFQTWEKARKKEDFKLFVPSLKKIVELEREKANLLGYKEHPYDALLNIYERGLTVGRLESVFDQVRKEIVPLVQEIAKKNNK